MSALPEGRSGRLLGQLQGGLNCFSACRDVQVIGETGSRAVGMEPADVDRSDLIRILRANRGVDFWIGLRVVSEQAKTYLWQ